MKDTSQRAKNEFNASNGALAAQLTPSVAARYYKVAVKFQRANVPHAMNDGSSGMISANTVLHWQQQQ